MHSTSQMKVTIGYWRGYRGSRDLSSLICLSFPTSFICLELFPTSLNFFTFFPTSLIQRSHCPIFTHFSSSIFLSLFSTCLILEIPTVYSFAFFPPPHIFTCFSISMTFFMLGVQKSSFSIDSSTGALTTSAVFDYEAGPITYGDGTVSTLGIR